MGVVRIYVIADCRLQFISEIGQGHLFQSASVLNPTPTMRNSHQKDTASWCEEVSAESVLLSNPSPKDRFFVTNQFLSHSLQCCEGVICMLILDEMEISQVDGWMNSRLWNMNFHLHIILDAVRAQESPIEIWQIPFGQKMNILANLTCTEAQGNSRACTHCQDMH